MSESLLAPATLRLAGDDLYREARARGVDVDFGDFEEPDDALEVLGSVLDGHGDGSVHPGDDAHPGADLAFRLAVVDAAFRPNPAVSRRNPSSEVRTQLEELIKPALIPSLSPVERDSEAARVVSVFENAHNTATRSDVVAQISGSVSQQALLFLTLECSQTGESVIVDGSEVTAMALFDYQETTMTLDALQGITDPLNWPSCNSAFKRITPVPGSYWESPVAHGIDIVEVFAVPFLSFETTTALSITYVDTPRQKAMVYDLSTASAHLGDGHVAVDRGFARAVDLGGNRRRAEALKVVHFRDDPASNATSWFSCLWWDLLSVRTAVLCPNRQVTSKIELQTLTGPGQQLPLSAPTADRAPTPSPGPLETIARAWSDLVLDFTREASGVATRTAKRWPPGEQVTGGKLTSDLIEGFERLTPALGKGVDLWLRTVQDGMDRMSAATHPGGDT